MSGVQRRALVVIAVALLAITVVGRLINGYGVAHAVLGGLEVTVLVVALVAAGMLVVGWVRAGEHR